MFKNFYNRIYKVPSVFLHEMSHLVVAFLLGGKLKKVQIKKDCVILLNISNLKNITQVRIVAMAPLIVPLVFIGLSFVDVKFLAYVAYSATVFKTTFPSPTDFKTSNFRVPKFLKNKNRND
jgi:hypothetical protein